MSGYRTATQRGGPVGGHAASRYLSQRISMDTLSRCETASEWQTIAGEGATVTITEVTSIDDSGFPAEHQGTPELAPFAFSRLGPWPSQGDTMLKVEVSGGTGTVFLPFAAPLSFDPEGANPASPAAYVFRDTLTTGYGGAPTMLLYTGTPGAAPYWYVSLTDTDSLEPAGMWHAVACPVETDVAMDPRWFSSGSPSSKTATGIGFTVTPSEGQTFRMYVSGVFRVPHTRTRGGILLDFDDGLISQYATIFPYMAGKGYKANVGMIGDFAGDAGYMSAAQMQEMAAAGWDMVSHSWTHQTMASLDTQAARVTEIRTNAEWLRDNGAGRGRRFFVAPSNSYTRQGNELIRTHHDMSRGRTGAFNIVPAFKQFNYYSVGGNTTTLSFWTDKMAIAERTKTVFTVHVHGIDAGFAPMTEAFFQSVIDAIADYDIDVLTWSDVYAESLG